MRPQVLHPGAIQGKEILPSGNLGDRSAGVADIPKQDRHLALNLLLEFSVQKGTLREMLGSVRLLFRIWNRERSPQAPLEDNRDSMDAAGGGGGGVTDAPLVGFLRRVEAIEPSEQMRGDEVEWDDYENVSATQCFLKYLEYPECEETPIDLKQAAVIVMSHLDRLSIPHQPALEQNAFYATVSEPQEVHWLGQVPWGASECNYKLGNVEVSTLAAYHRGAIGVAKRGGKMFYLSYDSKQPHYLETHLR